MQWIEGFSREWSENTVIPVNPKIEGEAATREANHAKRALNSWLKELNPK